MQMPVAGLCRACYMRDWRAAQPTARKPFERSLRPCTYKHAHTKLRRYRGRAATYTCMWADGCDKAADEWSYRGNSPREQSGVIQTYGRKGPLETFVTWSPDVDDYDALCHHHHLIRDGKREA